MSLDTSHNAESDGRLPYRGLELGFHPADDERNPRGGSPVVYWGVDDVDEARARLLAAGCEHHRGPLAIEPGRRIAQVRDPFGTIVGIEGK